MTPAIKTLALVIGLLAVLPLSACVGVADPAADSSPLAATSTLDDSDEAADQTQAALSPADQAQPDGVRPEILPIGRFRGLTSAQVTEVLGKPQFLRNDTSVELWQYRGDGCVLHLFLYRSQDGLRVQHAEVRPRSMSGGTMNGVAADTCLTKLTAAPHGATS